MILPRSASSFSVATSRVISTSSNNLRRVVLGSTKNVTPPSSIEAKKHYYRTSTIIMAASASSNAATASDKSETTNGNRQIPLASRLNGLDAPTVWHEFSPLAAEYKSINLGQGFPDWDPPAFVREAMVRSVDPQYERHANQYARSYAHMPLATVLANDYNERWKLGNDSYNGRRKNTKPIDPVTQVATAVGCTNALYCALHGLINRGDEAILIEPYFDIYSAQVTMAGGKPVYVPLRTKDSGEKATPTSRSANDVFTLDLSEIEAAITPKTKVLLLNTPHNPTGKMFTRKELESIAAIVTKHPHVTVISDEVYEHIIFEPETHPHISIASLNDDIFQQTLTLSSAGKTFSCTGWKVGWAIGPPHLIKAVIAVQQWVNFSAPTPNQDAVAQALMQAKQPYEGFASYYEYLASEYKRKRDFLAHALESVGMIPILPTGGFFIMADTSGMDGPPSAYLEELTEACPKPTMPRDWALSRWLTKEVGVTAIPPSAFYSPPNLKLASNLLRFAYCKGDPTLQEAHARLDKYFLKK